MQDTIDRLMLPIDLRFDHASVTVANEFFGLCVIFKFRLLRYDM